MEEKTTKTVKQRILFSPLDWGLGHASRSIFLIRQLVSKEYEVILACDGASYFLLESVFPELKIISLPFYSIRYSRYLPVVWKMFFSLPWIFLSICKEHKIIHDIVEQYAIDIIVSDHRYGLHHHAIKTVFITHQLYIRLPGKLSFLEPLLFRWNHRQIQRFDHIWVLDFEQEENLAGILSHPPYIPEILKNKIRYIGLSSRFLISEYQHKHKVNEHFDIVVVLSGPEPQRTILEKILISRLWKKAYSVLIIRGKPWKKQEETVFGNIQLVSHLCADLFYNYLKEARYIISRAGYSTIMDLVAIGKSGILIPTPGQTEQEYLADYLSAKNYFVSLRQDHVDLEEAFNRLEHVCLFSMKRDERLYEEVPDIG